VYNTRVYLSTTTKKQENKKGKKEGNHDDKKVDNLQLFVYMCIKRLFFYPLYKKIKSLFY